MSRLVIQGGRVIDPGRGFDAEADVVVEQGRVRSIEEPGGVRDSGDGTIDARGLLVSPGLIDPHVHFREPGQEEKETIASGSRSAVRGGFTSVCCMPNTSPALDDDGRIEFVYRQAEREAHCNVYPAGAITKSREGRELAEIGLMAESGAVAFTDDGDAVASAAVMSKALAYVKMTGRAIMQHCEEPTLVSGGSMNAGALAQRLGLSGRPAVAEELLIQRDVLLNERIGCRYHVQHLSTARGAAMVGEARRSGQPVTAELSPHHLLLTEDHCSGYDTRFKMNPPLRTRSDLAALLEAAADGTVTILATDHAPHTQEEKELEFARAPSGVVGLDAALALYVRALIEPGVVDWPGLLAMMTVGPASLLGLQAKGRIAPGYDADLTLIDPSLQWTIDPATFAGKGRCCPFEGWVVSAAPVATIVAGELRFTHEAIADRVREASALSEA